MKIEENIQLAPLTTFDIGGKARFFCRACSLQDLEKAILFARERRLPFFVLGGGSNVLVSDAGFNGLVIKVELLGIDFEKVKGGVLIAVGAGESWDEFVHTMVKKGLYGVENLSGVPGTVGGAPVQNIGAYGVELADTLAWVEVFDAKQMKTRRMTRAQCKFGYRNSVFKNTGARLIITKVAVLLSKKRTSNLTYKDVREYFRRKKSARPTLANVRSAILEIRSRKFPDPRFVGTAGSFFKNPVVSQSEFKGLKEKYPELISFPAGGGKVKISLAWIVEHVCKMKNLRAGNVGFAPNQALVLCNFGNATATEIHAFAREIKKAVFKKTGVKIEPEVCFVPSVD